MIAKAAARSQQLAGRLHRREVYSTPLSNGSIDEELINNWSHIDMLKNLKSVYLSRMCALRCQSVSRETSFAGLHCPGTWTPRGLEKIADTSHHPTRARAHEGLSYIRAGGRSARSRPGKRRFNVVCIAMLRDVFTRDRSASVYLCNSERSWISTWRSEENGEKETDQNKLWSSKWGKQ